MNLITIFIYKEEKMETGEKIKFLLKETFGSPLKTSYVVDNQGTKIVLQQGGKYENLDLSDADLSGMDLRNIKISNSNLQRTILNKTNISGSHLDTVNLSDADFSDTDISNSTLIKTELPSSAANRAIGMDSVNRRS
jgi:hypothetical protein